MSNVKGFGHGHGGARGPTAPEGQPSRAPGEAPGPGPIPKVDGKSDAAEIPPELLSALQQADVMTGGAPVPPPRESAPPSTRIAYHDAASLDPHHDAGTELRGESTPVQRPVGELVPELHRADSLSEVRERFSADYAMMKRQIVDVPDASGSDKAQRAFQFFASYAARFVAVATGESQQPTAEPPPEDEAFQPQAPSFERDAPVQATSEEGALWGDAQDDGEGIAGEAEAMSGRLGKLLKSAQDAPEPGRAGKPGQGKEARSAREQAAPFLKLVPSDSSPRTYDRKELRAETHAFAEALRDLHFGDMRDEATGKDGLQLAFEMLTAGSTADVEDKADSLQLRAGEWPPQPPAVGPDLPPEEPPRSEQPRSRSRVDLGESVPELDLRVEYERMNGSPELMRVNPWAAEAAKVVIQAPAEHAPPPMEGEDAAVRGRLTNKRLGPNMLWNVLHKLRGEGEDSTIEQGNWDKLTFAAIAFLVLVSFAVIALAAL